MAAPTVVGSNFNVIGLTTTWTTPALPAGWQAGDLLYAFAATGLQTSTFTGTTGLTEITQSPQSDAGGRGRLYRRVLQAGDTTWPVVANANVEGGWILVVLRGANTSTMVEVGAADLTTTTSTKAITISALADSRVIKFIGIDAAADRMFTPPGTMTELQDQGQTAGDFIQFAAFHETVAAAGSITRTTTITNNSAVAQNDDAWMFIVSVEGSGLVVTVPPMIVSVVDLNTPTPVYRFVVPAASTVVSDLINVTPLVRWVNPHMDTDVLSPVPTYVVPAGGTIFVSPPMIVGVLSPAVTAEYAWTSPIVAVAADLIDSALSRYIFTNPPALSSADLIDTTYLTRWIVGVATTDVSLRQPALLRYAFTIPVTTVGADLVEVLFSAEVIIANINHMEATDYARFAIFAEDLSRYVLEVSDYVVFDAEQSGN